MGGWWLVRSRTYYTIQGWGLFPKKIKERGTNKRHKLTKREEMEGDGKKVEAAERVVPAW